MSDFIKKNKFILIIVGVMLLLLLIVSMMGGNKVSQKKRAMSHSHKELVDNATGDNTAESLNALTQQLHQVLNSNKQLQKSNADLNKKNAHILRNIKKEVQANLETELQKRGEDNKAKIATLQSQLDQVNNALNKEKQSAQGDSSNYAVDGGSQVSLVGADEIKVNGESLVAIPDISGTHTVNTGGSDVPLDLDNHRSLHNRAKKPIPYYTINNGATLASSVSMTALIGRVPVNGVVKSPYPFKVIVDGNNMAANGLYIPGISGAIVQGYATGDMALSCVRGYITTITFIFRDGRISTTSVGNAENSDDLGANNSLGYLSTQNGNTCFPGKFYTNAPKYLATMAVLGGINLGGSAFQQAQMTNQTNFAGGTTSALTGSVTKSVLGGIAQGSTQQVMDWYTQREKNSFDAVYVPAGTRVAINITKQIEINYDPKGRKLYYEHTKNTHYHTSLD